MHSSMDEMTNSKILRFFNQICYHMETSFLLSVVISRLQGLTNALKVGLIDMQQTFKPVY